MQREVIRPGESPVIVSLKFDEPLEVEGQFGTQFQYACTLEGKDAVMWLPREAKLAIENAGAKRGDEIAIAKRKEGRRNVWQVQKVEEEPLPAEPAQPAAAPHANGNAYRDAQPKAEIKSLMPSSEAERERDQELARIAEISMRAAAIACRRTGQEFALEFSAEDVRGYAQSIFNARVGKGGGK